MTRRSSPVVHGESSPPPPPPPRLGWASGPAALQTAEPQIKDISLYRIRWWGCFDEPHLRNGSAYPQSVSQSPQPHLEYGAIYRPLRPAFVDSDPDLELYVVQAANVPLLADLLGVVLDVVLSPVSDEFKVNSESWPGSQYPFPMANGCSCLCQNLTCIAPH